MRKSFSIAGALAGLAYTVIGMIGSYRHVPSTPGQLALEFLVLSCFTAPLGGAIGIGFGLLVEAFVASFRKQK